MPIRYILCCIWLLWVLPARPQADAGGYRIGPVYGGRFPDVDMVLEVSDRYQEKAAALTIGDVVVIEDGRHGQKATRVRAFGSTGYGIAIAILVDVSGSMAKPLTTIQAAVQGVVGGMTSADKVALISFADDERVEVGFDQPTAQLSQKIQQLRVRGGSTQLYRAITKALNLFEEVPGLPVRRRIVVLSDGRDEKSTYTYENAVEKSRRLAIPIDTIGMSANPGRVDTTDQSALERLSDTTGGNYRFVTETEQLAGVMRSGIDNLQATPVVTFGLQQISGDGEPHQLGVQWSAFGGERTTRFLAPSTPSGIAWWHIALVAAAILVSLVLLARMRKRPLPASVGQAAGAAGMSSGPMPPRPPSPRQPTVSMPAPVEPVVPQAPAARSKRKVTLYRAEVAKPEPGEAIVMLRHIAGPESGRRTAVNCATFWIGASSEANLCIDSPEVSAAHACIQFERADLYIWDQSTNGTLYNGEVIRRERRRLHVGDEITVGNTVLRVEAASS